MAVIDGTDDDDVLVGTSANDIIHGFAGNDTLDGLGGANQLYGGDGDDLLRDAGRASRIEGGAGSDRLRLDRSAATASLSLVFKPVDGHVNTLSDGTTLLDVEALDLLTGSGNDKLTGLPLGTSSWNGGAGSDAIALDFSDL